MFRHIVRFARDERGSTAIEYALIGGLISVAIVVAAIALGTKLGTTYNALADKVPS